jgi:hypothetical protein
MPVTQAGGKLGIPGPYVTDDPGARDQAAKTGNLQGENVPSMPEAVRQGSIRSREQHRENLCRDSFARAQPRLGLLPDIVP